MEGGGEGARVRKGIVGKKDNVPRVTQSPIYVERLLPLRAHSTQRAPLRDRAGELKSPPISGIGPWRFSLGDFSRARSGPRDTKRAGESSRAVATASSRLEIRKNSFSPEEDRYHRRFARRRTASFARGIAEYRSCWTLSRWEILTVG